MVPAFDFQKQLETWKPFNVRGRSFIIEDAPSDFTTIWDVTDGDATRALVAQFSDFQTTRSSIADEIMLAIDEYLNGMSR